MAENHGKIRIGKCEREGFNGGQTWVDTHLDRLELI